MVFITEMIVGEIVGHYTNILLKEPFVPEQVINY